MSKTAFRPGTRTTIGENIPGKKRNSTLSTGCYEVFRERDRVRKGTIGSPVFSFDKSFWITIGTSSRTRVIINFSRKTGRHATATRIPVGSRVSREIWRNRRCSIQRETILIFFLQPPQSKKVRGKMRYSWRVRIGVPDTYCQQPGRSPEGWSNPGRSTVREKTQKKCDICFALIRPTRLRRKLTGDVYF